MPFMILIFRADGSVPRLHTVGVTMISLTMAGCLRARKKGQMKYSDAHLKSIWDTFTQMAAVDQPLDHELDDVLTFLFFALPMVGDTEREIAERLRIAYERLHDLPEYVFDKDRRLTSIKNEIYI